MVIGAECSSVATPILQLSVATMLGQDISDHDMQLTGRRASSRSARASAASADRSRSRLDRCFRCPDDDIGLWLAM